MVGEELGTAADFRRPTAEGFGGGSLCERPVPTLEDVVPAPRQVLLPGTATRRKSEMNTLSPEEHQATKFNQLARALRQRFDEVSRRRLVGGGPVGRPLTGWR